MTGVVYRVHPEYRESTVRIWRGSATVDPTTRGEPVLGDEVVGIIDNGAHHIISHVARG